MKVTCTIPRKHEHDI